MTEQEPNEVRFPSVRRKCCHQISLDISQEPQKNIDYHLERSKKIVLSRLARKDMEMLCEWEQPMALGWLLIPFSFLRKAPLEMRWFDALEGHPDLGFAVIKGAFSQEEIEKVNETPHMLGSVFADDRSDGLEFHHNVWRIEVPLKRCFRALYEKVLALAEECDDRFWFSVRRARSRYILCPEIEYIEYDADANPDSATKPSIEPHIDNCSLITMVAMLTDPNKDFEGGVNYFEPGVTDDLQSDSSDSDASSMYDDEDCALNWDWASDSDEDMNEGQTMAKQNVGDGTDSKATDVPSREYSSLIELRRFRKAMARIERVMHREPDVPVKVHQGAYAEACGLPQAPLCEVQVDMSVPQTDKCSLDQFPPAGDPNSVSATAQNQCMRSAEEAMNRYPDQKEDKHAKQAGDQRQRRRPGELLARRYALQKGDAVFFRGEKCEHWINDVVRGRRAVLQMELAKRDARDDWTPQTPYPEKIFRGPKRTILTRNSYEKDAEEAEVYLRTSPLAAKRFCRMHTAHKDRRRKAEMRMDDAEARDLKDSIPQRRTHVKDVERTDCDYVQDVGKEEDDEDWLRKRKYDCLHSTKARYALLRWLDRAPYRFSDGAETSPGEYSSSVIPTLLYLETFWELENDLTTTLDVKNENLCILVHSVAMQHRETIENRPYLLKRSLLYK